VNGHLKAIASAPRPVGSTANAAARQYCANHLRSLGFDVAERPFVFSALPGRYAAQLIGAVAVIGFAGARVMFAEYIGQLTALLIIVLVWALSGPDATREPWLRESGVNLEATRGGDPRVWLVAHVDSKSQPIPTAVRSIGVLLVAIAVIGQLFVAWTGDRLINWTGVAGGILLLCAAVGSRSDGAADNASGVAAVLEAAALLGRERPVGVLITDAEELSLADARAWVAERGEKGIALNCDTIDDDGLFCFLPYGPVSRPFFERVKRRYPGPTVLTPLHLPGVLTDSDAFRAAGWETVTLGRGTLRTLGRIHTKRDSLESMRGTSIPDAARMLTGLVEELA
jgi:hypothetical protein